MKPIYDITSAKVESTPSHLSTTRYSSKIDGSRTIDFYGSLEARKQSRRVYQGPDSQASYEPPTPFSPGATKQTVTDALVDNRTLLETGNIRVETKWEVEHDSQMDGDGRSLDQYNGSPQLGSRVTVGANSV